MEENSVIRLAISLQPFELRKRNAFSKLVERYVELGIHWLEIRDDFFSEIEIKQATQLIPTERLLISFRSKETVESTARMVSALRSDFDWPIEFGACVLRNPAVLSLHERNPQDSIAETLQRFPTAGDSCCVFKAALKIDQESELSIGHRWQQKQKSRRAFLPISASGKWKDYRIRASQESPLVFLQGSVPMVRDQPRINEWLKLSPRRRVP